MVSKSLITRQQREAVLPGGSHFHNTQLHGFVCNVVCALMNLAMGGDHCKVFDLNAENCNLKVAVNDTQTISVIVRIFAFLFLDAQLFLDLFFFSFYFLLFPLPEDF